MTLPTSGTITLTMVLAELRIANSARALPIFLGDSDVRALAGKPSGPISLSDLYGKSSGPPPLTLEAYGNSARVSSVAGDGTVSCGLTGIARGGVAPRTYLWEFTSNPLNFSISGATTSTPTISKTYTKNSNGGGRSILKCTARDAANQTAVVTDIYADLYWDGNA